MMRIGVLGINHKSSELCFRERLAKACRKRLNSEEPTAEQLGCVVLSTCNRTEVYFSAEDLAVAQSALLAIFREEIQEPFEHMLYTYFGIDCFAHLAYVTSGLDSVILAESEIQRQVKVAYENTRIDYALPSCIHYLFQKCLKIGKQIRSSASIPRGQMSLPEMVFQLAQWTFKEGNWPRVLFIGNSEINRKILALIYAKGMRQIALCTRSLSSARGLQESYGVKLMDFSQCARWKEYDLIISGTNCSEYLLFSSDVEDNESLSSTLMLDLSVPRNIDPSLARHPQITLMNMEEIGHLIERKQERDLSQLHDAETFVWNQVERQVRLFMSKTELKVILSSD